MSHTRDPDNNFIEFAQVWGGFLNKYLEGVIMYDSRNGRFTVQLGYKIVDGKVDGKHLLQMITTNGDVITIERKKGKDQGKYRLAGGRGHITASRTYLPADKNQA